MHHIFLLLYTCLLSRKWFIFSRYCSSSLYRWKEFLVSSPFPPPPPPSESEWDRLINPSIQTISYTPIKIFDDVENRSDKVLKASCLYQLIDLLPSESLKDCLIRFLAAYAASPYCFKKAKQYMVFLLRFIRKLLGYSDLDDLDDLDDMGDMDGSIFIAFLNCLDILLVYLPFYVIICPLLSILPMGWLLHCLLGALFVARAYFIFFSFGSYYSFFISTMLVTGGPFLHLLSLMLFCFSPYIIGGELRGYWKDVLRVISLIALCVLCVIYFSLVPLLSGVGFFFLGNVFIEAISEGALTKYRALFCGAFLSGCDIARRVLPFTGPEVLIAGLSPTWGVPLLGWSLIFLLMISMGWDHHTNSYDKYVNLFFRCVCFPIFALLFPFPSLFSKYRLCFALWMGGAKGKAMGAGAGAGGLVHQ